MGAIDTITMSTYRFNTRSDAEAIQKHAKQHSSMFAVDKEVKESTTVTQGKANTAYRVTIASTPYFKKKLEEAMMDSNIKFTQDSTQVSRQSGGFIYDYLNHIDRRV